MFNNIFPKILPFLEMWKYGVRPGRPQTKTQNTAKLKLHTHTQITKFNMFSQLNVSLTVHHELTIQKYQRDAMNIIYSSNIITLLYMFRVSSTHLQEDIVVHKQHMVPSLSIES